MEGKKFDSGKLKTGVPEARPMEFFYGSFTYGAAKYHESSKERNYKKVSDPEIRYDEALERHRLRRNDNQPFDLESGLPHSALIMFNAFCLLTLDLQKYGLTYEDLQELMSTWTEMFKEGIPKLPDPRVLATIEKFKGRIHE
jgi:hypothetical protein